MLFVLGKKPKCTGKIWTSPSQKLNRRKVPGLSVIKTLELGSHWQKMLDLDPHWNQCGMIHNPGLAAVVMTFRKIFIWWKKIICFPLLFFSRLDDGRTESERLSFTIWGHLTLRLSAHAKSLGEAPSASGKPLLLHYHLTVPYCHQFLWF